MIPKIEVVPNDSKAAEGRLHLALLATSPRGAIDNTVKPGVQLVEVFVTFTASVGYRLNVEE